MIEIYCGDGKGKTTAAAGLALRAAGNGIPVLFIQFMKDGSSGEIRMLKMLKGVDVYYPGTFYGFAGAMNRQQKEEMRSQYAEFLGLVMEKLKEQKNAQAGKGTAKGTAKGTDIGLVIVLDEVIHACNKGLLKEAALLALLEECPGNTEIVLTGRKPPESLLKKADYISVVEKRRHPFDRGVPARKGIER